MNALQIFPVLGASLFSIAMAANCVAQTRDTPHEWNATIKVVDDIGQPVSGAETWVSYYLLALDDQSKNWDRIGGLTDSNGVFIASHIDQTVTVGFHAQKSGYYSAASSHQFGFNANDPKVNWNPSETLVLRRVIHPIPMYARRVQIEMPKLDGLVGYDLMLGDWVAPYGKGKVDDFIFQSHRQWINRGNFDVVVKLSFSNSGDGVIPISGPLAFAAPLDFYNPMIAMHLSHTPGAGWKKSENNELNYYLRVRTQKDDSGNVKNGFYGKIYGDFALDPINSRTIVIIFTYYLNPVPNSRNLEYDGKNNLFENLPIAEQVTTP